MKKILSFAILIFFLLSAFLSFASCTDSNRANGSETNNGTEGGGFPYTFTDNIGKTITLTKKPEKVAVLFSSFADIWTLSGGDIYVTVGDSVERGFASEEVILVDNGAGHTTINTELLVSKMPDLVICTADYTVQAECADYLSSIGIPSAVFKVESVDDYLRVLKIFTDINQTPNVYQEHGTKLKESISSLLAKVSEFTADKEPTDILFVRAGSSQKSTKAKNSADNFACRMLGEMQTYNIADSAHVLLDGLSLEEILIRDPEYIFITTMGDENAAKKYISDLFCKDGWKDLSAVKAGKFIFLPKELFHYKPNSRWLESYEFLSKALYPTLDISK